MNAVENELQKLQEAVDALPDSIKKEILLIKIDEIKFVLNSYPVDEW